MPAPLHGWSLSPSEAIALQRELAGRIDTRAPLCDAELIGGADISYARHSSTLYAGIVVLRLDTLDVIEKQSVVCEATFPYVPGLLSFREAPPVLEVWAKLQHRPQVLMLDGQGVAHPRRFGLACHLGLWLDLPTIGCAKSLLVGKYKNLDEAAGSVASLEHGGETVGFAVRTRTRVQPVYVSAGHRIDLPSAVRTVLLCCRGYRLPEPTRQAHLLVNEVRGRAAC